MQARMTFRDLVTDAFTYYKAMEDAKLLTYNDSKANTIQPSEEKDDDKEATRFLELKTKKIAGEKINYFISVLASAAQAQLKQQDAETAIAKIQELSTAYDTFYQAVTNATFVSNYKLFCQKALIFVHLHLLENALRTQFAIEIEAKVNAATAALRAMQAANESAHTKTLEDRDRAHAAEVKRINDEKEQLQRDHTKALEARDHAHDAEVRRIKDEHEQLLATKNEVDRSLRVQLVTVERALAEVSSTAQIEKDSQTAAFATLEEEKSQAEERLAMRNAEYEQLEETHRAAIIKLAQAQAQVMTLEERMADHQQLLKQAERTAPLLKEKERVIQELNDQLTALTQQHERLQAQHQQLDAVHTEVVVRANQHAVSVDLSQQHLGAANKTIARLEALLAAAERERDEALAKLNPKPQAAAEAQPRTKGKKKEKYPGTLYGQPPVAPQAAQAAASQALRIKIDPPSAPGR